MQLARSKGNLPQLLQPHKNVLACWIKFSHGTIVMSDATSFGLVSSLKSVKLSGSLIRNSFSATLNVGSSFASLGHKIAFLTRSFSPIAFKLG